MRSWDGRVQKLCDGRAPRDQAYVLYWMQAALRTEDNPALDYAIEKANALGLPLLVLFTHLPDYPEANRRHFHFLFEGLAQVWRDLKNLGAQPIFRQEPPLQAIRSCARQAALVVLDRGYLRWQKIWYRELTEICKEMSLSLHQVEGEVLVPLETASTGSEHAARTIRPRLKRHFAQFLVETSKPTLKNRGSLDLEEGCFDPDRLSDFLAAHLPKDGAKEVPAIFGGGPAQAHRRLEDFLAKTVTGYAEGRNHPHTDSTSTLSPYLHFGMISPVRIALATRAVLKLEDPNRESFLEELLIRRSLSQNYCLFNERYDQYDNLPQWARTTLEQHREDPRPYLYRLEDFEQAQTHDPYWNAAQIEMVETGYMHNYMRMYWGKKILEWSGDPEEAFRTTLTLNNRYLLDGRDPASFANVGWIFGLHDRGWPERAIYGKVRCMMASGLERKTEPKRYVQKVAERTGCLVPGL